MTIFRATTSGTRLLPVCLAGSVPLFGLFCGLWGAETRRPPARIDSQHFHGFLLSDWDFERLSPDSLSRDEALQDFSGLREILREAYGGYDYFKSKGTDWDGLSDATVVELRGKKSWGTAAFFGVLTEFFKKAKVSDGHLSLSARSVTLNLAGWPGLSVWVPRFADYYVRKSDGKLLLVSRSTSTPSGAEELLAVEGGPPDRFLFPTRVPGQEGEFFLIGYFGDKLKTTLRCQLAGSKEPKVLPLHAGKMWRFGRPSPAFEETTISGVPVITLRTLHEEHAAELERFVQTAQKLRREPVVVLDLRGNDGGSDGYGIRWLRSLTSGTIHIGMWQDRRTTPLASVGAVNEFRERLHSTDAGEPRAALEARLAAATRELDAPHTTQTRSGPPPQFFELSGAAPRSFTGRLIVLSDRRNGSAGESFLEMVKALPGTVVLGENSYGVNAFGPVGLYQLPNSAIRISLGAAINRWDGKLLEGAGILPDFWIDEPDALPVALDYAKSLDQAGLSR